MNTRSYNFASKGRGKRGLAGWRKPGLENDLAVRLGVGRKLYNAVEHLVELGIDAALAAADHTPDTLASGEQEDLHVSTTTQRPAPPRSA